ncbi:MAG TPA: tol-pal system protein YbgF [Alphaproteobacteria bacterium]|nr:tol-pal system protein YbgF [Alphaproteobacteria bacterium]
MSGNFSRGARRAGLAILLLMAGTAPAALAQSDPGAVAARIQRLERDIATLNQMVFRGQAPAALPAPMPGEGGGSAIANLEVRLTQLEEEIRNLTGQVEEVRFLAQRNKEQMERMNSDLEVRFQELDEKLAAGAPAATATAEPEAAPAETQTASATVARPGAKPQPGQSSGDTSKAPTTSGTLGTMPAPAGNAGGASGGSKAAGGNAQDQYDRAQELLRAGDYAAAEKELSAFLKANPTHTYAPNAQYWLAETHYVRGNYTQAAALFAESYKKHGKGPKAPDSLLKLALSLAQMNRSQDACVALSQLKKDFPTAAPSINNRANKERDRLKCSA